MKEDHLIFWVLAIADLVVYEKIRLMMSSLYFVTAFLHKVVLICDRWGNESTGCRFTWLAASESISQSFSSENRNCVNESPETDTETEFDI